MSIFPSVIFQNSFEIYHQNSQTFFRYTREWVKTSADGMHEGNKASRYLKLLSGEIIFFFNYSGIKHTSRNYFKEGLYLCSDEHISSNYFPKFGFVREISSE